MLQLLRWFRHRLVRPLRKQVAPVVVVDGGFVSLDLPYVPDEYVVDGLIYPVQGEWVGSNFRTTLGPTHQGYITYRIRLTIRRSVYWWSVRVFPDQGTGTLTSEVIPILESIPAT